MPNNQDAIEGPDQSGNYDYNPMATTTPVDDVMDAINYSGTIQNPDDVVGICSECKTVHEAQVLEKDIFVNEGVASSCRYCGGVVVLTFREKITEGMKDQLDARRGIGFG